MTVDLKHGKIILQRGALSALPEIFSGETGGKTLIVTDSGVPEKYSAAVAACFDKPCIEVIPQGETSKNAETYLHLCQKLLSFDFCRDDRIIAVGGGVPGDIAGFAASTYMRGLDFYNIPTTLLSQIDSSVGGKTAIDFCGIKNVLGTFYPPRMTVIDPETLKTLPHRQIACGYAEAIKAGLIGDETLFGLFEGDITDEALDEIISRALKVKIKIVEEDEYDKGIRAALNFGHTVGHAIESVTGLLHGECVALGMLCMCSEEIYPRLFEILKRTGLPTTARFDAEKIAAAIIHDKKMSDGKISAVIVDKIGTYKIEKTDTEDIIRRIDRIML